jgi:hypothetical protein
MKHAVVYVPGASQNWLPQSVDVIAERLGVALAAARPELQDVRVTVAKGAVKLRDGSVDRATIEGLSGGEWREMLDLFEVDYVPAFTKRLLSCNSFERALSALSAVVGSLGSLRHIYNAETKAFLDKAQCMSMIWLMVFLATYLVYWCALAVAGLLGLFGLSGMPVLNLGAWRISTEHTALLLAIGAGSLALCRLSAGGLMKKIEHSAIEYFALIQYIRNDAPFSACQGLVRDAVVELRREGYDRVDMLAFSLGCVIAGDTIYPRRTGLRMTTDAIDGLATIGYPYDFVKAAYPRYFTGRKAPAMTVQRWWNVTEAEDFLGSNFRNDDRQEDPQAESGIFYDGGDARPGQNIFFDAEGKKRPSWKDLFVPMRRVINHRVYWDPGDPHADSCFAGLVAAGFCAADAALGEAADKPLVSAVA